jgi:ABC-2 type transport system permease protein
VASVAGRELRSLFVSPIAYGVLSLFAVLAGIFFILFIGGFLEFQLQLQRYPDQLANFNLNDSLIREFFGNMGVVLLFLIPGITMGTYAAEKSNGTEELLLTSPLTIWDIVLGKFAAGAAFIGLLVAIVGFFPGLLFFYGNPEVGKTWSGLLGLLLTGWTYVAIGGFASAITRSQIIAFLISLVVLIVLLLAPAVADYGLSGGPAWVTDGLRYVSTQVHFEPLLGGEVDTSDLAYFAVMVGTFLLLTKAAVESARWR